MSYLNDFPEELRERFQPRALLGRGGMGKVIQAYEPALDRDVAIKLALSPDPRLLERLRREAQILSEIRHPHVVEVYDFGVAGDQAYLIMEYLDGLPLNEVPEEDVVPALFQVAEALQVLHRKEVLHRDLKPQNIFLTREGRAVLIDFGLVKPRELTALTATGAVVGTLPFIPPECHGGRAPGPEADWYALGVTLYWLFEHGPPFEREQLLAWAAGGPPPELAFRRVPEDGPVARVVRACLATRPEDRPRRRRVLEALYEGKQPPPPSPPPSSPPPASRTSSATLPRPVPRRTWMVPVLLLLGVGLGAGMVLLLRRPPLPEVRAVTTEPGSPAPPPLPAGMRELGPNSAGRRQARNLVDGSVMILLPPATIEARGVITFDSRPVPPGEPRRVAVPALWIDKYEVTVARYARYLAATGAQPPEAWGIQLEEPQNPVCFVGERESMNYAAWAGGRLPTMDEWERAAAGPEGRPYPWGHAPPSAELAHFGQPQIFTVTQGPRALAVVGSFPAGASPDGVHDLMGNLSEWTAPGSLPEDPARGVMAGGSLLRTEESLANWNFRAWHKLQDGMGTGFRLVRDHVDG